MRNHLNGCFIQLANRLSPGKFVDVVAAWRGPDDKNVEVKLQTTAVIRRVILNEIPGWEKEVLRAPFGQAFFEGALVSNKVEPILIPENYLSHPTGSHFFCHVSNAARALGIEVKFYDE